MNRISEHEKEDMIETSMYAPYIRHKDTKQKIMLFMILAILPTMFYGIYNFGMKAVFVIVASVLTCEIVEIIYHYVTKKEQTWSDLSAVVTGLLFAMILPPTLSWWKVVLGAAIGMAFFRLFLGGLGYGYIHMAIVAKCIMFLFFYKDMNTFIYLGTKTKTPLEVLKAGGVVNTSNMLLGKVAGNIGEVSVLCVLLGAIFLILMGVINLSVAAPAIVSLGIFVALFGGNGFDWSYIVAQLCGDGFMFGIFFIATDGMTSPITPYGKVIYGIIIGVLVGVFRIIGIETMSVVFAIFIGNLCAPLLESLTIPKYFGEIKKKKVG